MNKVDNWESALYAYLDSRMETPFEWGAQDCATFASGAIESMTGQQIFTPTYSDALGAAVHVVHDAGVGLLLFGGQVALLCGCRVEEGLGSVPGALTRLDLLLEVLTHVNVLSGHRGVWSQG